jgi:predicted unusual protein kinase regulating ubiquinone biosynthesis (AarF/ABC1/UbiB family)
MLISYEELARQFLSDLDYTNEMRNLKSVYESSLDLNAPYMKHGVVLPKVCEELCTDQVITMSYLPREEV